MQDRSHIKHFTDIPNVGKATQADFIRLGFTKPQEIIDQEPYQLFNKLCTITASKQDPCVIDVFIAAIRYMQGEPAKSWWYYTKERKATLESKKVNYQA